MAKQTVQGLILEKINRMEDKIDRLIPVVEGLRVKAAIVGGISGLIGTGIVSAVASMIK